MSMAKICKEVWEKLFFAMLSGVLVVVFAVSGSAQERIRLSYSALSPSTAFLWIPKEKAFFKKHGLEVEILLIESGTLTSQALVSGEIGIADNAGAPAIISNASGSGETIIMGLVNSLAYNIVATKQVKDFADLKNRRIGVSRIGSSSHAAVAIALDHFKLDATRDNITYVQSGTMTTRIAGMWVAVVKQKWQIELSLHSILQILTVSVFRERASSRCSVDLMRTKKTPNQITIHSVH